MRPDGFVLAGGASVRMGVDKARVAWPGSWPMGIEVAQRLLEVCGRVRLVRRGEPDGLPWLLPDGSVVPVVRDPEGSALHALTGLATALEHGTTSRVVVVACDYPSVPVALLRRLIDEAPALADDGRAHPFVGVYDASAASAARQAAEEGWSARRYVAAMRRVRWPEALVNRNHASDRSRVARFLDGLEWLDDAARERVAEGERGRLAARGALDA